MKLNVYSIFDEKALAYNRPFFMTSHGVAIRSFGEACCDKNNSISKFPSDYKLYFLGTFDEETGKLESVPNPVPLSSALEHVQNVKPMDNPAQYSVAAAN